MLAKCCSPDGDRGKRINPEPVAIACCIGASIDGFATPVATTTVTMVQIAGYRFKDYLRVFEADRTDE